MTAPDCHVCDTIGSLEEAQVVLDEGAWIAYNVAGVPGWTMLAAREHVEGVDGLTDEQAATLGPVARRLGRAVRDATGADRLHLVYLGDNARHFHVGLFPRQAGEAGLFDNAGLVAEMGSRQDATAAAPLTAAIRDGAAA